MPPRKPEKTIAEQDDEFRKTLRMDYQRVLREPVPTKLKRLVEELRAFEKAAGAKR